MAGSRCRLRPHRAHERRGLPGCQRRGVANTTFSKAAGQPLLIRWKDARGAGPFTTTVRLDQAKLDPPVPGGAVQIFVEQGQLVVDDQESVRVERVNEISLAGGASGSTLSASTEHEIEFKVE